MAIGEVQGLSISKMPIFPIKQGLLAGIPRYIPTIHHGSNVSFRDLSTTSGAWAAIPISRIFRSNKKSGELRSRFLSEDALRQHFSLNADTNILALGVGFDQPIEDYWRDNQVKQLPAVLRELGVRCFIPPNYSMFRDAPRTTHLHNRKRSLLCGLRAAEAGLGVIPYLSALTSHDWLIIESFLREHPEISHVAEEFQTGTASLEVGRAVIRRLADIQGRLGRPMHFVLLGAGRFRTEADTALESWTLVDSNAFFDAQCRRRPLLVGDTIVKMRAEGRTTTNFARSVRVYLNRMSRRPSTSHRSSDKPRLKASPKCGAQLLLDFDRDA